MLLLARLPESDFIDNTTEDDASGSLDSAEELPVMRRSNKRSVQSQYEQAIAVVQQQWQDRMEDVRQTSRTMLIVGGAILGVGLLGLALAQGWRKVAIWGPGLVVALGSVLWGIFSANFTLEQFSGPATGDREMVAISEKAQLGKETVDAATVAELDTISNTAVPTMAPPPMPAEERPQSDAFKSEAEALSQQTIDMPAKPQVKLRTDDASFAEDTPARFNKTNRSRFFRGVEDSDRDGLAESGSAGGRPAAGLAGENVGTAGNAEANVPVPLRARAATPAATPAMDTLEMETRAAETGPAPFDNRNAGEGNASQQDRALLEDSTPQPVLWQPRLSTNSNGQVALNVTLPSQPGRYRLVIDAHGSGRLGTVIRYVEVAPPSIAAPVE